MDSAAASWSPPPLAPVDPMDSAAADWSPPPPAPTASWVSGTKTTTYPPRRNNTIRSYQTMDAQAQQPQKSLPQVHDAPTLTPTQQVQHAFVADVWVSEWEKMIDATHVGQLVDIPTTSVDIAYVKASQDTKDYLHQVAKLAKAHACLMNERQKLVDMQDKFKQSAISLADSMSSSIKSAITHSDLSTMPDVVDDAHGMVDKINSIFTSDIKNITAKIAICDQVLDKCHTMHAKLISSPIFTNFIELVKTEIDKQPVVSTNQCVVCLSTGQIMVNPLYSGCRRFDTTIGRFACGDNSNICLHCARTIFGLNKPREVHHTVRCHICRTPAHRPLTSQDAYHVNNGIKRTMDAVYTMESNRFQSLFGTKLNPVSCSNCDMKLATLEDMHHHLRGDSRSVPACELALMPCRNCRAKVHRRDMSTENPIWCKTCFDAIAAQDAAAINTRGA
jgi:hypothetical protein